MPLHPSGRSWEISREQVTVIKVIGKGAFSQVAQASVRDMRGRQENITVAVKMLKGGMPLIIVTITIFVTLSRQKLNKEIIMEERDEEDFKNATECYICNNPYTPNRDVASHFFPLKPKLYSVSHIYQTFPTSNVGTGGLIY